MQLGVWKNFEELEESLSVQELELIAESIGKKEYRFNKFAAGLKGVKLDDDEPSKPKGKLEEIRERLAKEAREREAKGSGVSVQVNENDKALAAAGIRVKNITG